MSCLNCRFCKPKSKCSDWGECRRFPPSYISSNAYGRHDFVISHNENWCGEFELFVPEPIKDYKKSDAIKL